MKTLFALIMSLLIAYSCSESTNSDENADPNGEEQLLADMKADESAGTIKVMTRNIYIGADIDGVLGAVEITEIPFLTSQAYATLQETNFPERAQTLAAEIGKTLPHLVGLQEVSKVYTQSPGDFLAGNPQPASNLEYDYLQLLLDALQSQGLNYTAVAVIQNADVELPMIAGLDPSGQPKFDDVRLTDHDVILARNDVQISEIVAENFTAALVVDTSLGIIIPRGYNAVKAKVGNYTVRFANTHLEAYDPEDILRASQSAEMMAAFENDTIPVIMVGDFNTPAPGGTTYQSITSNGYTDIWTENPLTYDENGNTYGHEGNLKNSEPNLFTRIDFIFVRSQNQPQFGNAFVIGDEKRDRTASGMWPSDHAGVITSINFAGAPMTINMD